jgi:hypothetical protein
MSIPVTVETYNRAESDASFAGVVARDAFGKLLHMRALKPLDQQTVVRPNRDTLYSEGVFDLEAGPVTIALPDAGKRFVSLQVIDGEDYTPAVYYGGGRYTLTRAEIGTRYFMALIRTLVDPNDPADLAAVHALQDAIAVEQHDPGKFEVPDWDEASLHEIRNALLVLGKTVDSHNMFGKRGEVDPIKHMIGTAVGWGGNPERDALYVNVTPAKNDGATVHRIELPAEVPVDGFWSISVYNAEGYFVPNERNAYSINNLTAAKNPDGSVTVQFGGCEGRAANCIPIMPGWNYIARLYRPRQAVLDGSWTFPEAEPVEETVAS